MSSAVATESDYLYTRSTNRRLRNREVHRNLLPRLGGLTRDNDFTTGGRHMDERLSYSAYVHARWASLVRSAVLLGCSRHEAEDLVQTALIRCLAAWDKVAVARDPDAYVYRVLLNCHASSRKRRWWRERPSEQLPDDASAPDGADEVVLRDTLRLALSGLSSSQRSVLVLRFYADLTERQVALVLDLPLGTVKSSAARGLEQLSRNPHLAEFIGTARRRP